MIYFNCPKCGKELSGQSKSGDCVLDSYPAERVPTDVAYDANRHAPFSCDCGASWEFGNIPSCTTEIALTIKPA